MVNNMDIQVEETENLNQKYVSEVIGEKYKLWKGCKKDFRCKTQPEGDFVYIDADTGTGKTYFVFNVLAQYAERNSERILYLCNRVTLKNDAKRLKEEAGVKNVDIKTYQSVEKIIAQQNKVHDEETWDTTKMYKGRYLNLFKYKYIAADEMHYFLEDSSFNNNIHYVHKFLLDNSPQVKILISATGGFSIDMFRNKIKHYYTAKGDKSYIKLHFYKDNRKGGNDFPVQHIERILEETDDDKIIYFVDKKERINQICEKHSEIKENAYCMYSKSQNDDSLRDENCIESFDEETISFDKRVLLTTSVMSNGVTLRDRRIKHIICDIRDVYTAIQCIGRKRAIDKNDECDVYIRYYHINELNHIRLDCLRKVKIITDFTNNHDLFCDEHGDYDIDNLRDCYYIDWLNNGIAMPNHVRGEKAWQDACVYQRIEKYDRISYDSEEGYDDSFGFAEAFKHYSHIDCEHNVIHGNKEEYIDVHLIQNFLEANGDVYIEKLLPAKGEEIKKLKKIFKEANLKRDYYEDVLLYCGFLLFKRKIGRNKRTYWILERDDDYKGGTFL